MRFITIIHVLSALMLSPVIPGIINKVKALFAGRKGKPVLQMYYDLGKLLRKGSVYSRTTTWIFKASPLISTAAGVVGVMLVPLGNGSNLLTFQGDMILVVYLFGFSKFATVMAALDTGSAFEGMGASREVQFSMLAEPAMLLGLCALSALSGETSLNTMFTSLQTGTRPILAAAIFIVLLAENSRIPFDDPNTHLELTMVHEAMILDHSGPDLALIEYGATLKFWIYASLTASLLVPPGISGEGSSLVAGLIALFLVAVAVGIVESIMARLRLIRVPQLLVGATILSLISLILIIR
ncbi:HyfC [Desulforapulum autotrophicum HRM2]|uniref:HyfC n=1 Tax=Desulforapulum autotrophicum (strain ATCC 43914 / DSM 3382 / VKM B-1955 / HRM2) TaxID=177437 RepID=C0QBF4_DESAH|nr:NADH-quinone oxidoreductase subunit H [Desulforapulum autotrophicum]ACN16956.1 HyfC [Desulforapulum autotrophicum HRM2]